MKYTTLLLLLLTSCTPDGFYGPVNQQPSNYGYQQQNYGYQQQSYYDRGDSYYGPQGSSNNDWRPPSPLNSMARSYGRNAARNSYYNNDNYGRSQQGLGSLSTALSYARNYLP